MLRSGGDYEISILIIKDYEIRLLRKAKVLIGNHWFSIYVTHSVLAYST